MIVKVTRLICFFLFVIVNTSNANGVNNNQKSGDLVEKIIYLSSSDDVTSFYKTGIMLGIPQIMNFSEIKVKSNGILTYSYQNDNQSYPLHSIRHSVYIEDNGFDKKKLKKLVQFEFKPQFCLKVDDYKHLFSDRIEQYSQFIGTSRLENGSGLVYETYRIRTKKHPIIISPFNSCMLETQVEYEIE